MGTRSHPDEVVTDWYGYRTERGTPEAVLEVVFGAEGMEPELVEAGGQTTITTEIEYQSQEVRDTVMQPGFKEGYLASYETLDQLLSELGTGS